MKIKELYIYREMIFSLVRRDLKGRYKGSVLGFVWTFLNPLFQLLVYTMVFSVIMKNDIEKYYLFLFVALVPWMFFSAALNTGSTCILSQADMINKIYFPREILPIVNVTSGFINMLLSFLVVFAVLVLSGFGLTNNNDNRIYVDFGYGVNCFSSHGIFKRYLLYFKYSNNGLAVFNTDHVF